MLVNVIAGIHKKGKGCREIQIISENVIGIEHSNRGFLGCVY